MSELESGGKSVEMEKREMSAGRRRDFRCCLLSSGEGLSSAKNTHRFRCPLRVRDKWILTSTQPGAAASPDPRHSTDTIFLFKLYESNFHKQVEGGNPAETLLLRLHQDGAEEYGTSALFYCIPRLLFFNVSAKRMTEFTAL